MALTPAIVTNKALGAEAAPEVSVYSCHPIMNLQVGPWLFENGSLTLSHEEAAEFEAFLEGIDAPTRHKIRLIDYSAAEALAKTILSGATKTNDSASGIVSQPTPVGTKPVE